MIIFIFYLFFTFNYIHASYTGYINSMFQEYLVAQPTPIVQLQFPYNNINTDLATTSISGLATNAGGTITQSTGMAILSTNGGSTDQAVLASIDRLTYKPGQGLTNIFSAIFDTGTSGSNQYIGVGNSENGFFFGYNGTSFGILYRSFNNGVTTDTWYLQPNWNVDPMNGSGASGLTLNPQTGNSYKIQYHWLGFGQLCFYVQNPVNGSWILVHRINILNNSVTPLTSNGSLQLLAVAANSSGNNVSLKTSSMMGLVEGQPAILGNVRNSYSFLLSFFPGSLVNIFSIRNKYTYPAEFGYTISNQVMVYPDYLTLFNPGSSGSNLVVYLYLNQTNNVFYTDLNTAFSVVGICNYYFIPTNGTLLLSILVPLNLDGFNIDLSSYGIRLAPGETLTIAAQVLSSETPVNSTIYAGLSWIEGF